MNLDPDRDLAFDLKTFPDPALKRIRISDFWQFDPFKAFAYFRSSLLFLHISLHSTCCAQDETPSNKRTMVKMMKGISALFMDIYAYAMVNPYLW